MTLTGRVPLLLLAGLVALVVRPAPTTAAGWVAAVLVLVASDVLLAPRPACVDLSRRPLGGVRQGQQAATALVAVNRSGRRVRGVVRDAWQPSAGAQANRHRLDLPAGDQVVLRTTLGPTRRGDRLADRVTVRTLGPLRLAGRQRSRVVPGRLRVLPPFDSCKHLPSRLARLRELDGRAAVRVRGQGTEFDSLRDYVQGDDVRSIDWRASARSRSVVVRTWQPERHRRGLLVLRPPPPPARRGGGAPPPGSPLGAAPPPAPLAGRGGG